MDFHVVVAKGIVVDSLFDVYSFPINEDYNNR